MRCASAPTTWPSRSSWAPRRWRCWPTTWASCGWRSRSPRLASVLIVAVHGTPPAIEAAWKLFILCGVGIALGAVRDDHPVSRGAALRRAWRHRPVLDDAARPRRALRPGRAEPRLRLPAGRLRHQGRAGAAAFLAAGCGGGGADRHLRGAVGPAAERRAACGAQGQGDRRRASGCRDAGPLPDRLRPRLAAAGRLRAVAAARCAALLRLVQHRAYGPRRARLRPRRRHRQPGRAAAHARPFADQVGGVLRRRPCGAAQGLAEDRRYRRARRLASRRSAGRWRSASRPSPGCRPSRCSPANSCC